MKYQVVVVKEGDMSAGCFIYLTSGLAFETPTY